MTTNFPAVMTPNDLTSALNNSQVNETSGGGVSFLRMNFENGEWSLGKEMADVTGDLILVNTSTIQHGWILWSGNRPTKVMSAFNQPLPAAMASIGDDHPSEGRCLQGAMADNGGPLSYESNSYGGRKGVDTLLGLIKAHAASGSQHLYPRVKLGSESYVAAKRGGKLVFNPIFEVVAWCDQDGNEEGKAPEQIADQTGSSAAQAADQTGDLLNTTPETTTEAAAEQPTRQRRRRRSTAA